MVGPCRSPRSAVAPLAAGLVCALLLPVALTGQDQSGTPAISSAPPPATDAERETFLKKARIVRTRPASKGVTLTLRTTLTDGVVTHDASIQTIEEQRSVFETPQGMELNFKGWTIWMIVHSRAFRTNATLRSPGNLSKVERPLLKRRDRIVEHFDGGGLSLLFDRRARCC